MQLDLLAKTPAARSTDPQTSHAAAEHITEIGTRASQQRQVLKGLAKHPGLTTRELAARMNVCRYIVARRMPELAPVYARVAGERKCTVTGRLAQVWMPTPAGETVGKGRAVA